MKKVLIITILLTVCVPAFAQTYTVERVIDGNTLKLTSGEEIALIGIEAPTIIFKDRDLRTYVPNETEIRQSKIWGTHFVKLPMMGQEATEFVRGLLEGRNVKSVILEYDVDKKDRYRRALAYSYFMTCPKGALCKPSPDYFYEVEREDGSYLFLNATIIRAGYASPMTIPPNVKYADLFKKLYEEAREQKRGLWR